MATAPLATHRHPTEIRPILPRVFMRTPLLTLALAAGTLTAARVADPVAIRGFTPESARAERTWETKFRAMPDPARMRDNMRRLSARPHHVGSPYDATNAEWLRDQFRSYGWQAE